GRDRAPSVAVRRRRAGPFGAEREARRSRIGEHVIGAQQHSNGVTEHRDVGLDWCAVYGAELDEPRAFGHAASLSASVNSAAPARTSARALLAGRLTLSPVTLSSPLGSSTLARNIVIWRSPCFGGGG